jgi:hypothetical protein
MSNRRTFLKQTAAIGGALGLSPLAKVPLEATVPRPRRSTSSSSAAPALPARSKSSMRLRADIA